MKLVHQCYKAIFSFVSTLAFCCSISWRASKFYTITRVLLSFCTPLGTVLCAYLTKNIINLLVEGASVNTKSELLSLIGLWGLVTVAIFLCQRMNQYVSDIHNRRLEKYLKEMTVAKALHSDLETFDNPAFFNDFNLATRNPQSLQQIVSYTVVTVSSFVSFSSVLTMVVAFEPVYALCVLLPIIPQFLIEWKFTKKLYNLEVEQTETHRKANYIYSIGVDSAFAFSIRTHRMENKLSDDFSNHSTQLIQQRKKTVRKRTLLSICSECPEYIILVLLNIDLVLRVLRGSCTVGDFSFISGLLVQLWNGITGVVYSISGIYDSKLKVDTYRKFQKAQYRRIKGGVFPLTQVESIRFDHVSFQYAGTSEAALTDVSFTLAVGQSTAMIGFNGSGKSTVIKLLMRLYEPASGEILINELPLRHYDLESLRRAISVYQQNEPNFHFSVRDNLDPLAEIGSDQIIQDSLKRTGADLFISGLPHGLDTFLGRTFDPDGAELSGGGGQRVALARAFCTRGSALVLDEPFSALDPEATANLLNQIDQTKKSKLILYTSHNLSSIMKADKIIILEKGRVVEAGPIDELMAQRGRLHQWLYFEQGCECRPKGGAQ